MYIYNREIIMTDKTDKNFDPSSSSSSSSSLSYQKSENTKSLHPNGERIPSPNNIMTVTNFSIAEILKPEFGVKNIKTNFQSAFTGVIPSKNVCSVPPKKEQLVCSKPERSGMEVTSPTRSDRSTPSPTNKPVLWPAWVFCTRYSDRPTSGPRARHVRRKSSVDSSEDKRPRAAFTSEQLQKLKVEFDDCRYLTENRRKDLAIRLNLTESQIKIWFQNKRAKLKKSLGFENPLAISLKCQGLYNHAPLSD